MGYARDQSSQVSKLLEIDYTNRAQQTSEFNRSKLVSSIESGEQKDRIDQDSGTQQTKLNEYFG